MTNPEAPPSPTTRQDAAERLVAHLVSLAARERRGELAALRRSLGHEPGELAEVSAIVERFLAENAAPQRIRAFYLVAGLFGLYPINSDERWSNFGSSLRSIRNRAESNEEDPGVARRFMATLDARQEQLEVHLRSLVTLLRSRSDATPINYVQLIRDLQRWDNPDRSVQRRWASGFWGYRGDEATINPVRQPDVTAEDQEDKEN